MEKSLIVLNEAPQLPLHPNCKCKLETIQIDETESIDFLDKFNKMINNISAKQRVSSFLEEYATLLATNVIGNLANARATSKYGKA